MLRLSHAALSADEAAAWNRRLDALRSECGCHAGAIGLVAAIVALPLVFWIGPQGLTPLSWPGAALALLLPAVSAIVGKLAAIHRARRALRRATAEFCARLAQRGAS